MTNLNLSSFCINLQKKVLKSPRYNMYIIVVRQAAASDRLAMEMQQENIIISSHIDAMSAISFDACKLINCWIVYLSMCTSLRMSVSTTSLSNTPLYPFTVFPAGNDISRPVLEVIKSLSSKTSESFHIAFSGGSLPAILGINTDYNFLTWVRVYINHGCVVVCNDMYVYVWIGSSLKQDEIDAEKWQVWYSDERCVKLDDAERYKHNTDIYTHTCISHTRYNHHRWMFLYNNIHALSLIRTYIWIMCNNLCLMRGDITYVDLDLTFVLHCVLL